MTVKGKSIYPARADQYSVESTIASVGGRRNWKRIFTTTYAAVQCASGHPFYCKMRGTCAVGGNFAFQRQISFSTLTARGTSIGCPRAVGLLRIIFCRMGCDGILFGVSFYMICKYGWPGHRTYSYIRQAKHIWYMACFTNPSVVVTRCPIIYFIDFFV